MPNHCSNRTAVTGPKEDMERFLAVIKYTGGETITEQDFGLTNLWPIPEGLNGTNATHASAEPPANWAVMLANGEMTQERYDELVENNAKTWAEQQENEAKHGYKHWYNWAMDNWGTKWGDYEHWGPECFDELFAIWYSTAWAPYDEGFWHKVSLDWPTLTFVTTYDEPGMQFYGAMAAHNGVTVDVSDDYPETDIDWDDDDAIEEWRDQIAADLDRFAAEAYEIVTGSD